MGKKDTQLEWFVRQVAEGTSGLNSEQIGEMSRLLEIPFCAERYFCAVASFSESQESDPGICMPLQLYQACLHAKKQSQQELYCYIGDQLCTVMVIADTDCNRAAVMGRIYQSITKSVSENIRIGVGRSYDDLKKLSYSWVEAYEAVNISDNGSPISYVDDIYASRSMTTYKHYQEKRQIVSLFKHGDVEQMKLGVNQLVENVRAESPVRLDQPYPTSIRRTIVELLVEILHIGADAGVDVDVQLNYEDPYTKIFQMADTPSILAWFFRVVEKLAKAISEQHSKTDSNMMVLAKKKISDHLYDPELSLSLISSQLDITPAYFSAFFIREVGIGFNEYVTGLRIEKAKQLLSDTNLKISTIADQCGFRSSSYFIVVFRKQIGMSPGEYRNTKNQNK